VQFGEDCDDGNIIAGDGCSPTCRREPTIILALEVCGDGILQAGEECDDGNNREFDGCSSDCRIEKGVCGDGIVQTALEEQCEPTTHDPDLPYGCNENCQFTFLLCGDGKVDEGEECDAGLQNSNLPDAKCRTNCIQAGCGDGIMDSGETCDDGNDLDGDGCDRMCMKESMVAPDMTQIVFEGRQPTTITFPGQQLPVQPPLSLASLLPLLAQMPQLQAQVPVTQTGPAAVAVIAAGASAGFAWVRRRRKK